MSWLDATRHGRAEALAAAVAPFARFSAVPQPLDRDTHVATRHCDRLVAGNPPPLASAGIHPFAIS